jgi:hypothetical protein
MILEMVFGVVSLAVTIVYSKSIRYGTTLGDNIPLFLCSLVVGFSILLFVWEVVRYSKMIDERIEELLRGSDTQNYNIKARR